VSGSESPSATEGCLTQGLRADLLVHPDVVAALRDDWDFLAQHDLRDGFFRTATWYLAWRRHIRPDATPFVISVRSHDGRLLGLAPLCRVKHRDLGFRLDAIGFGGREVVSGDYLDILAAEARPAVVEAVLDQLWHVRSRWGLLVFGETIDGGDFQRTVESWAAQRRLAIRRQEERTCPYIELPRRFDEYLRSVGDSMRYQIRRRTRDVLEKNGARVDVCTRPDEIADGVATLVRLHLARWRSADNAGTLGQQGFAEFLRDVCLSPPAGARPRLYLLNHDGRPAAALLAFHFGETALYYQAGWDPDSPLSRLSPGVVLMGRSIEDAILSGLRYYDFLRGDEAYKSRWTKTARTTTTLLVARTPMARAYLATARLKDRLKPLLRSRARASAPSQGDDAR